jgi:putative spermidine/putrescine transport system ATP-binding protein
MSTQEQGSSVELARVSKAYGTVRAVDDVSLDIGAGEFFTLLGPSGSGKTTMLNLISGFVMPDAGDVVIGGQSVIRTPPYRRGIGMVFQNYALFPHMNVFDNIAFPLRMRRSSASRIARAVTSVLEMVQLPDLGARFPHQLSGGQQQRVALARALVFDPQVLLMDEPLGALDKNLREQLQYELRRLHQQLSVTIVYVTHDQQEALVMSDRIAVMNHGRIVQLGTGHDLYEQPSNAFVAQFLGESNLLNGTVLQAARDTARVLVDGLEMPAACSGALVPGQAVRVLLRPERILTAQVADPGYRARVEDASYLGEALRVVLQLEPGPRLIAKMPGVMAPKIERGTNVTVTWKLEDARVLESEFLEEGAQSQHSRAHQRST